MDQIEQILDILSGLLSAFPTTGASASDGDAALRAYMIAIEGRTVADVREGCRRLIAGEIAEHDGRYAPTPPQIARAVRAAESDRLTHERRANPVRTLSAPTIDHSPESRARIAAMTAELLANLNPKKMDALSDKEYWASTHEMFMPDMSEAAVRRRLGYSTGDADGDRDVA